MERVTLAIDGIYCGRCVATVLVTLAGVPGVSVRSVTMDAAVVDAATASAIDAALAALAQEGFPAQRQGPRPRGA